VTADVYAIVVGLNALFHNATRESIVLQIFR
jgi:hypothetical protein